MGVGRTAKESVRFFCFPILFSRGIPGAAKSGHLLILPVIMPPVIWPLFRHISVRPLGLIPGFYFQRSINCVQYTAGQLIQSGIAGAGNGCFCPSDESSKADKQRWQYSYGGAGSGRCQEFSRKSDVLVTLWQNRKKRLFSFF